MQNAYLPQPPKVACAHGLPSATPAVKGRHPAPVGNTLHVVPVAHAEKYRRKLPNAHIVIYKSKGGHFQIEKFPEIVAMIKRDVGKK